MEWTYSELLQKARPRLTFDDDVVLSPDLFRSHPLFLAVNHVHLQGELEFNSSERWVKVSGNINAVLRMKNSYTGDPVELPLHAELDVEYTFNREPDHDDQLVAERFTLNLDEQIAVALLMEVPFQIVNDGFIPPEGGVIPW
jgi:uncharacterized metal-binding protein YceD (DUF177 family)